MFVHSSSSLFPCNLASPLMKSNENRGTLIFREITVIDIPMLFYVRTNTRENRYTVDELTALGITKDSVRAKLTDSYCGWLCEVDATVVGFSMVDCATGELWVIAVLPQYEGLGIGSQLMEAAENRLWAQGCDFAWLPARVARLENRKRPAIYAKMGNCLIPREISIDFFPPFRRSVCRSFASCRNLSRKENPLMPMPYYVSPEQMMQDKAEYARKGIAKGKPLVVLEYADGIMLAAENPSSSLSKISEIYDRVAFAGVGKYSEFESLRKSGIRYADIKGYTYSRDDVTGKSLANAYSQVIGNIFTKEIKPLEVEIFVAEVGETTAKNSMYHILFDGSISDRHRYAVIGGHAEPVNNFLKERYQEECPLNLALALCKTALEKTAENKIISVDALEVAILDRNIAGRKFRRVLPPEIKERLAQTT